MKTTRRNVASLHVEDIMGKMLYVGGRRYVILDLEHYKQEDYVHLRIRGIKADPGIDDVLYKPVLTVAPKKRRAKR